MSNVSVVIRLIDSKGASIGRTWFQPFPQLLRRGGEVDVGSFLMVESKVFRSGLIVTIKTR